MPVSRRRRLNQVTPHQWPRIPASAAKWPAELRTWAEALLRVLELRDDLAFGIQDNGTDMPLRAILDFIGASLTDDLANDRTQVSIAGGAGAAPVNATYLVVSLNGTLSAERVLVAGAGLTSTDGGANGNFTLNVGSSGSISVAADSIAVAASGVGAASYGSATQVAAFTVGADGRLTAAGNVAITYPTPTIVGSAFTVATLPAAPPQGTRAWVTDATAPTFLGALVGGGAVVSPAFYDGAVWISA